MYSTVVIINERRFWKRILIVNDYVDTTMTFKTEIEDNNNTLLTREFEVHTSNNPVIACQNSNQISMISFWLTLICNI
jgi:hypothetical protein